MTISTEVRRAGPFTGTGLVATYAFAFKIFATSDVVVTETDLTGTETTLVLNTDYTVSMNADQDNDPGGDVVLTANLTTDYLLTITSDVPELQSVELTNLGGFYPTVLNPLFDKLVILCQQISEKLGRQITLPVSSAYTDITIPDPQANYYLQWKEDLTGLKNVAAVSPGALSVSPYIETLLNDADAATARTTLGVSASGAVNTSITDAGGYYTGSEVETALQEIGARTIKVLGALAYKSAVQSLPDLTETVLSFDTEVYDYYGIHSAGIFTVPAGVSCIRLWAHVAFAANATGYRAAYWVKNADALTALVMGGGHAIRFDVNAVNNTHFEICSLPLLVVPGDYFRLVGFQYSGGALNALSGTFGCHAAMEIVY